NVGLPGGAEAFAREGFVFGVAVHRGRIDLTRQVVVRDRVTESPQIRAALCPADEVARAQRDLPQRDRVLVARALVVLQTELAVRAVPVHHRVDRPGGAKVVDQVEAFLPLARLV